MGVDLQHSGVIIRRKSNTMVKRLTLLRITHGHRFLSKTKSQVLYSSMSKNEDNQTDVPQKTEGESWIQHFFKSFSYSLAGIVSALKLEMAFRMEVFTAVLLIPVCFLLPVSLVFKALIISSMLLVLIVELLNSSIEWVVDYISMEKHPFAKRAKDMGSAAVFFALVSSGIIWIFALIEWLG